MPLCSGSPITQNYLRVLPGIATQGRWLTSQRDLPAPAAAAAVPPAALLAPWPVVASGGERRDVQPETRRQDRGDGHHDGRREYLGKAKRDRMESNLELQRLAPTLVPQGANAAAVAAMPGPSRAARPAQGPAPVAAGTPALPATPPLARPFLAQYGQQTPQAAQPNQNHRGPAAQSEQPRPYLNASRPPEPLRDQPQRPVPQARVNAPAPVVIQAPNSQAAAEQARVAARSQEQAQQRAQRDHQQQEQGRQQ